MSRIVLPAQLGYRYRLVRQLGSGGLGTAFEAVDLARRRTLALKLLSDTTPERLEILQREFSLLSGLVHENLARVIDFGSAAIAGGERAHFYTSELIDGVSLGTHAQGKPWSSLQASFVQVLAALDFLHRKRIRHGDVKPDNVLVGRDGNARLIDLSCSMPFGAAPVSSGTRGFMAPELSSGAPADARSDLYSVGVTLETLFAKLAARPPKKLTRLAQALRSPNPDQRPLDVESVLALLGVERPERWTLSPEAPRLLERDAELRALLEVHAACQSGRPGARVALVRGPRGSGKTRLLNELAWRAELESSVIEVDAGADRPIRSALELMLGEPIGDDLAALLGARDRLAARGEPCLMLVDDAERLPQPNRAELMALIRSTGDRDRIGIIVTGDGLAPTPDSVVLELRALGAAALEEWCGQIVPHSRLAELDRATSGLPSAVHRVLTEICAGRVSESEIGRVELDHELGARTRAELRRASDAELDALALIGAAFQPLPDETLDALGVALPVLARVAERGWVRRESGALRLEHGLRFESLAPVLGSQRVRRAHGMLGRREQQAQAEAKSPVAASEHAARAISHAFSAGRAPEAIQLFSAWRSLAPVSPRSWLAVAECLLDERPATEMLLALAELFEACGQPERAIELLSDDDRWPEPSAERELRLGSAFLARGEATRAAAHLERARRGAQDPSLRAKIADQAARAAITLGEYKRAFSTAQAALSDALAPPLCAALLADLGAAASYLGELGAARDYFERAATLAEQLADPRARYRAHSYRAFHEYRSGNAELAIEHYARALEIAESQGLDDRIATAALSLGAAQHQTGAWAEALGSYERGLRAAVALAEISSEALLRFDIAKLYADLGLFERALAGAERARELAQTAALPLVDAAASVVQAEVMVAEGKATEATLAFERARDAFAREQALREECEVTIQLAEARLETRALDAAARELERARLLLDKLDAADVRARFELCRGRHQLLAGDVRAAQRAFETAAEAASALAQPMLQADVQLALAELWQQGGAFTLAEQARGRARERWERISAALPDKLRDAFWRHPARRQLVQPLALPAAMPSSDVARLRRLLEINKRLCSTLDPNEVLERTMDAAIELTGAERGFLIQRRRVRQRDELFVSIARNLEREQIGKRHLKFSRTIAERTMLSDEPVLTLDASNDERFGKHASVHAMKLKSVVCVPIRSPSGVVGALYLDNRFRIGGFRPDDLELLMAFGDQVAIALENARLHAALAAQSAELERERERVEQLSRAQADEIGRLTTRVREQERALTHRYDYRAIVGKSAKMQELFATLDRVTDSSVSVLIEGESGTGKELVARAIHFNGPRRDRAYLAINCGALPAELLESELFGHVRGAFTGADREREGLLVSVSGGTIFLDEIGELPLDMQVKLLRVLQERELRPLGSSKSIKVDFRLISATNRRLRDELSAGRFREDLFYRIGVVELALPPLRDRIEDLPDLIRHFVERIAREQDRKPPRLTPAALRRLAAHDWPGNIRELENVLTRTLVIVDRDRIDAPDIVLPEAPAARLRTTTSREAFAAAEAEQIREALRANRWNVSATCRALGLARSSFYRKLERYGIELGSSRA